MSASFLLRARCCTWCSSSTSVIVRSGQPAAAMHRTAHRENAFHATMSPNSSSDNSRLRGLTRCDDETIAVPPRGPRRTVAVRWLIGVYAQIDNDLLTIYLLAF